MLVGGLTGEVGSATFYGVDKATQAIGSSIRNAWGSRGGSGLKSNALEEMPSGRPQHYTSNLSQVTGKIIKKNKLMCIKTY